jgi:hypothetical protein
MIRGKYLLLLALLVAYHTVSVSAFSSSGCNLYQARRGEAWLSLYPTPTSVMTYSASPFAIYGSRDPNDSISSSFSTSTDSWVIFSAMRTQWINWWFRCRKFIRYLFQKCSIYVLECEHGKFYVGSTRNKRQRLAQHFDNNNNGSVWTNQHKPIRVLKVYTRVPCRYRLGMESQVTAELMLQRGVNSVRGAMYSQPRRYTQEDGEALVGFLGHYNDLSYKDVRERLESELPKAQPSSRLPSSKFDAFKSKKQKDRTNTKKKARLAGMKCYRCGLYGHLAADCEATSDTCFLCGELGHFAGDCPHY